MNNLLRVKCPNCQKVQDINGITTCQCGFNLEPQQGTVTLYRKGHPIGSGVGAGVYIDGQPFGHLAVTEAVTETVPQETTEEVTTEEETTVEETTEEATQVNEDDSLPATEETPVTSAEEP